MESRACKCPSGLHRKPLTMHGSTLATTHAASYGAQWPLLYVPWLKTSKIKYASCQQAEQCWGQRRTRNPEILKKSLLFTWFFLSRSIPTFYIPTLNRGRVREGVRTGRNSTRSPFPSLPPIGPHFVPCACIGHPANQCRYQSQSQISCYPVPAV